MFIYKECNTLLRKMSYDIKKDYVTPKKIENELKAILYDMQSKNTAVIEDACYKWVKLEEKFAEYISEEKRKELAKRIRKLKHYS